MFDRGVRQSNRKSSTTNHESRTNHGHLRWYHRLNYKPRKAFHSASISSTVLYSNHPYHVIRDCGFRPPPQPTTHYHVCRGLYGTTLGAPRGNARQREATCGCSMCGFRPDVAGHSPQCAKNQTMAVHDPLRLVARVAYSQS